MNLVAEQPQQQRRLLLNALTHRPTVHTVTKPAQPVLGDVFVDAAANKSLAWDGSQWCLVEFFGIEPDIKWVLTERQSLWVLVVPDSSIDAVDEFIDEQNLRALRYQNEVIFRDFDEAALVRLKFQ
jgi:hypothetical protein